LAALRNLLKGAAIAAALSATISPESLWTDEAFSAFLASHRTLASCWSALRQGDSSDLQMVLYYLYLHLWSQWFGQSEIAFRSANIPFILLFSAVAVWGSQRLFHSTWVWIMAALSPLAVVFASDTRPYFDIIAFSFTCLTCLLVWLKSPTPAERKILPWLVLLSLLLGALFHMLTLLLGLPLLVLLAVFWHADRIALRWRDWLWPLLAGTPVFLIVSAYFAWTLGRGASYDYAHPDLLSMASVLFRFAGLSGFVPNRHYDNPIRPYLAEIALSGILFLASLAALFPVWSRSVTFRALFLALAAGIGQILVLSFALHQQIEFRHLSSLLPLLLLLIMSGLTDSGTPTRVAAASVLGVVWLISDIRLLTAPEYRREDFRAAVAKALELQASDPNAVIAVAADPLAAAYYGLSEDGPAPCFPLTDSCQQGLSNVDWPRKADAQYALFWSDAQIRDWLHLQNLNHKEAILLISRSRHPIIKNSAWWAVLQTQTRTQSLDVPGFSVYLLASPDHNMLNPQRAGKFTQ